MQIERDEKTDIPTVKQTDRQTEADRWMDGQKDKQKKPSRLKEREERDRQIRDGTNK